MDPELSYTMSRSRQVMAAALLVFALWMAGLVNAAAPADGQCLPPAGESVVAADAVAPDLVGDDAGGDGTAIPAADPLRGLAPSVSSVAARVLPRARPVFAAPFRRPPGQGPPAHA